MKTMTKRGILALFVLMLAVAGPLTVIAWATGNLDWVQVSSYTPDPTYNGRKPLTAISFSSSSNGNAVGYYTDSNTSGLWLTQAQHWDGTSWGYVPSYNYSGTDNFLYGVTTVSSTDAWAVGSYNDSGHQRALVLHYSDDADAWVNYSVTVSGSTESVLTSVTSNSSSDVWAVGYYLPNTTGAVYRTLTMHYNGSSWSVVSSPNATPSSGTASVDNKLFGVTNVPGSSNLFWAAGAYNDGSGNIRTLIMKGDTSSGGSIWSIVSSYNGMGAYNCLRSVSALDSNNAWAVGFQNSLCFDLPTSNDLPSSGNNVLLERWNGSAWSSENPPSGLPDGTLMYGVSVASSNQVWAAGYYTETIVLGRANGAWTRHNSESPDQGEHQFNRLLAVDALSDTLAWTAGWYFDEISFDKPTLIEHYVPPTPTPVCCP